MTDQQAIDDTPLPQDLVAERAILGACLLTDTAVDLAVETGLHAADFHLPAHETLWAVILEMRQHGDPVDAVTVLDTLTRRGAVGKIGGAVYLHTLMASTPTAANVGYYARIVRDKAGKRRGFEAGAKLIHAAMAPDTDAADVQAVGESAVAAIAAPVDDSTWSTVGDILTDVQSRYYARRDTAVVDGIRWGYADVDRVMTPLQPGDFAVVIAFAGGGKSVVAANLALDAAVNQGKRALVHTMEMSRREVGQRWAAKTAGIRLDAIIRGELTPAQEYQLDAAVKELQDVPLIVDECESVTLSKFRASIRKHRPDVAIADQIPIMLPDDPKSSREQQVASIAYGLKRIASAEKCAVVACAQLNSAPMQRGSKRPTQQDIRESRAIGQAANVVVILSDPMMFEPESPRAGEIDWIVEKQRQGQRDTIVLAQQFHFSRLANLAS